MRGLSLVYQRVGNVLTAQGKLAEALASCRQSFEIHTQFESAARNDNVWQNDLIVLCLKLGDLLKMQGRHEDAFVMYHHSLDIAERLVATRSPASPPAAQFQWKTLRILRLVPLHSDFDGLNPVSK